MTAGPCVSLAKIRSIREKTSSAMLLGGPRRRLTGPTTANGTYGWVAAATPHSRQPRAPTTSRCKARVDHRVVSQAVVVAADVRREVLGFDVGDSEHGAFGPHFCAR